MNNYDLFNLIDKEDIDVIYDDERVWLFFNACPMTIVQFAYSHIQCTRYVLVQSFAQVNLFK